MRALDTHLHLWDPALLDYDWLDGVLRDRFGVDELRAALSGGAGPQEFVFVQAGAAETQALPEVDWVASLAADVGVRGIVAGIRLDSESTAEMLAAVADRPLVVGVRHLLQAEPAGFSRGAAFRAGAALLAAQGLTFDACVNSVPQLRDVAVLAADLPDLQIVLDHLGKPEVGSAGMPVAPAADWIEGIRGLAAHPNAYCKLSGLPAEAGGDWSAAQLTPFFDVVAEAFGPDRLMLGGDWPVSAVVREADGAQRINPLAILTWTGFVAEWAAARRFDVDRILWRNAERFYRLS